MNAHGEAAQLVYSEDGQRIAREKHAFRRWSVDTRNEDNGDSLHDERHSVDVLRSALAVFVARAAEEVARQRGAVIRARVEAREARYLNGELRRERLLTRAAQARAVIAQADSMVRELRAAWHQLDAVMARECAVPPDDGSGLDAFERVRRAVLAKRGIVPPLADCVGAA